MDVTWMASFQPGELVLPWYRAANIRGLPIRTLEEDMLDSCSICLERLVAGDSTRLLPCFHLFHVHCIDCCHVSIE